MIGHSHLCKVFALTRTAVEELPSADFVLEPDKKYIVLVGSVGQPRDFDNRASYTVFDTETRRFEFKRVEYDIELRSRQGASRPARTQLRPSTLYRRLTASSRTTTSRTKVFTCTWQASCSGPSPAVPSISRSRTAALRVSPASSPLG